MYVMREIDVYIGRLTVEKFGGGSEGRNRIDALMHVKLVCSELMCSVLCMYVCMHACMSRQTRICVCVYIYIYMSKRVHILIYIAERQW